MARGPITVAELEAARAEVPELLRSRLTDPERRFLLSMKLGEPDWDLLPIPHLRELPALQWKLAKVEALKREPRKHAEAFMRLRQAAHPPAVPQNGRRAVAAAVQPAELRSPSRPHAGRAGAVLVPGSRGTCKPRGCVLSAGAFSAEDQDHRQRRCPRLLRTSPARAGRLWSKDSCDAASSPAGGGLRSSPSVGGAAGRGRGAVPHLRTEAADWRTRKAHSCNRIECGQGRNTVVLKTCLLKKA